MKMAVQLIMAAAIGSVVLAEQPPTPRVQPRPAPAAAAPAAAGAVATNDNPRIELRDIENKLHPFEMKLMDKDPEIKALLEKRKAFMTAMADLDAKKDAKIEEKLAADPATAALEARRKELKKKIQEMRLGGAVQAPANARPNNAAPPAPAVSP